MTSWLNTSGTLLHTTPLPAEISRSKAIKFLQNHEVYIKCDPHMIKYELISEPSGMVKPTIPEDRKAVVLGEPVYYSVTDKVHALPKGLWDSNAVSTYEFVPLETGVFARVYSPLSIIMETIWYVRETEDGKFELVEDIVIKASRLLIGTVKGLCNQNWAEIHEKMVNMMKEDTS